MRLSHLIALLAGALAPAALHAEPSSALPPGTQVGRCLYVDHGRTRIAGRCFYRLHPGGDFEIDGPRQRFGGRHTVDGGSDALHVSHDWWANVFRSDGGWSGYGNGEGTIGDVHGGFPWRLQRRGACFTGSEVKVCLWREL